MAELGPETIFTPVFTHTKTGNRYIITQEDFIADDLERAKMIGFGAGLMEAIMLGSKHEYGDILEFDPYNLKHVTATLGGMPVAMIAGPILDEADECPDATESHAVNPNH